ncbi:cytochrome c [Aquimarina sp. 2201CG1-2-11]|uniref:cytochrome c n=1 Tax=Aquimarina discodermiae TaxID=3231043 RepID=UPI003462CDCF
MKSFFCKILILTALATVYSCSSDSNEDVAPVTDPDPDPTGKLTYTSNVKTIIDNNCIGCHGSPLMNNAPFPLLTFAQVDDKASAILTRISIPAGETGVMPPGGKLNQNLIETIDQWIKDGKLE